MYGTRMATISIFFICYYFLIPIKAELDASLPCVSGMATISILPVATLRLLSQKSVYMCFLCIYVFSMYTCVLFVYAFSMYKCVLYLYTHMYICIYVCVYIYVLLYICIFCRREAYLHRKFLFTHEIIMYPLCWRVYSINEKGNRHEHVHERIISIGNYLFALCIPAVHLTRDVLNPRHGNRRA